MSTAPTDFPEPRYVDPPRRIAFVDSGAHERTLVGPAEDP
jgi:hypothetical protein